MKTIIGIKLSNRNETSIEFQKILSDYGCSIRTRIGLHDTHTDYCTNFGIVLLEVIDDKAEALFDKLSDKWECQKMSFYL